MLDEREDFDITGEDAGEGCVKCKTCWDWFPAGDAAEGGDDAGRCQMCRRWIGEAERCRRLAEQQRQMEVVR